MRCRQRRAPGYLTADWEKTYIRSSAGNELNRFRFSSKAGKGVAIVDIIDLPFGTPGWIDLLRVYFQEPFN